MTFFNTIWDFVISHVDSFIFGMGCVFAIYSLSKFKSFLIWIKGGIEDGDGLLENNELQIAFFSILGLIEVLAIIIWESEFPPEIIYATFAGAGILYTVNRGSRAYEETHKKDKKENKKEEKFPEDLDDYTNI